MKILNPQSATLTNYEVYAHLASKREAALRAAPERRHKDRSQQRKLGAPNYEAVSREMLEYLSPGSTSTSSSTSASSTITSQATSRDNKDPNTNTNTKDTKSSTATSPPPPPPAVTSSSPAGGKFFPLPAYSTHFSPDKITSLITDLAGYDLAKAELLMIANLRPMDMAGLDAVVEELDERFDEAAQEEILAVIARWIGVSASAS